jgi:hypothetical protein
LLTKDLNYRDIPEAIWAAPTIDDALHTAVVRRVASNCNDCEAPPVAARTLMAPARTSPGLERYLRSTMFSDPELSVDLTVSNIKQQRR